LGFSSIKAPFTSMAFCARSCCSSCSTTVKDSWNFSSLLHVWSKLINQCRWVSTLQPAQLLHQPLSKS
jgi:hypothetical protein